jgi:GNAT superfamily N-acetyltransferase
MPSSGSGIDNLWPIGNDHRMLEVCRAGVDRVPAIAEMLARAFVDEPMLVMLSGKPGDPAAGRRRFFELLNRPLAELGCLYEIGDASAAAAWIPPDAQEVWARVDAATRPAVRELTSDGGRRWEATWDWVLERIPAEPIWFLDHIGVEPRSQGTGLGGALIEHGLTFARADGISAFLETTVAANVPAYEHFDFRVVDHGDTQPGGPHSWLMRWDP